MEDKKKYFCKFCNYSTEHACDWIKHSETDKHKRNGKKHKNVIKANEILAEINATN